MSEQSVPEPGQPNKPEPKRKRIKTDKRTPAEIALDNALAMLREHWGESPICILIGETVEGADDVVGCHCPPHQHGSVKIGLISKAYDQECT